MSKRDYINGIKIIDATEGIHINVSNRDAANGKAKSPDACAAAKCCVRTLEECSAAKIHLSRAYLKMYHRGKPTWFRYNTSQALRAEIIAFDRGAYFAPGVYFLAAPSPSQQKSAKSTKRSGSRTNKNVSTTTRKLRITTGVRPHGANK